MRRISRIYGEALSSLEITPSQLFALTCLGDSDGLKPRDLAEQISLDSSSLTGLLDRLEAGQLVQRRPDPRDRRSLRVHLTDQGRQRLADLEPVIVGLQDRVREEFFADDSPEDFERFMRMLRRFQQTSAPDESGPEAIPAAGRLPTDAPSSGKQPL